MKYNIITTSDSTYYYFLKILINSILKNCDMTKVSSIIVIDNGLEDEQIEHIKSKSDQIRFIHTNNKTNFKGGIWGDDWQINVKSKTEYLLKVVEELKEPVLMLDSDMMVLQDLYQLIIRGGGDIQVCYRPKHEVPYIGSYFFSINHEKSIPFIRDWSELTNQGKGGRPNESPALVSTVGKYNDKLQISRIDQLLVNVTDTQFLNNQVIIVHFKGNIVSSDINKSIEARVHKRGWSSHISPYLD